MSYDGWRSNGYAVAKGEKCRRRVQGRCVYHESQVEPLERMDADFEFDPYDEIKAMCYGTGILGGRW